MLSLPPAGSSRFWSALVSALLAAGFGAAGLYAFYGLAQLVGNWVDARSWERVPAQVLAADLRPRETPGARQDLLTTRYSYSYRGTLYIGDRVDLADTTGGVLGSQARWRYAELAYVRDAGAVFKVWVNPNRPEEAVIDRSLRWSWVIFLLPFGLLFSGVSLAAWYLLWRAFSVSPPVVYADVVALNPDRIGAGGAKGPTLATVALVANVLAWPIAVLALGKEHEGVLRYGALVAAGGATVLAVYAARRSVAWRRHGEAALAIRPEQPCLGDTLVGRIEFAKPPGARDVFIVTLACENVTRSADLLRAETIWQENRSETAMERERAVSFAFQIPYDLPPSSPQGARYVRWVIRCLRPGPDLPADVFEIAVGPKAPPPPMTLPALDA